MFGSFLQPQVFSGLCCHPALLPPPSERVPSTLTPSGAWILLQIQGRAHHSSCRGASLDVPLTLCERVGGWDPLRSRGQGGVCRGGTGQLLEGRVGGAVSREQKGTGTEEEGTEEMGSRKDTSVPYILHLAQARELAAGQSSYFPISP
uniref:Uncharacterized protein n=1 Tax=Knipowitschia caucasica TaxID=637954 RepID=A0AAV2LXC3_KNICA